MSSREEIEGAAWNHCKPNRATFCSLSHTANGSVTSGGDHDAAIFDGIFDSLGALAVEVLRLFHDVVHQFITKFVTNHLGFVSQS